LGCGGSVANYILSQYIAKQCRLTEAIVMSIYAVEKVKKVDAYCDGPVRFGLLRPDGGIQYGSASDSELVTETVKIINEYDEKSRKAWKGSIDKMIQQAAEATQKNNPPKS
jgi:hypothetical protein